MTSCHAGVLPIDSILLLLLLGTGCEQCLLNSLSFALPLPVSIYRHTSDLPVISFLGPLSRKSTTHSYVVEKQQT